MPGSFSDWAEAKILNHIFGGETWNPPSLYLGYALSSGAETGPGTEAVGAGYSRVPVNSTFWSTSTAQETHNILDIKCPKATAVQGSVVVIQLWDSSFGGNMIDYIPIDGELVIENKDTITIPAGVISHTWQVGGFTNYLKNMILNHVYEGVTMPINPKLSFNYMTSAPSDLAAGNEPSAGSGGARLEFNNNLTTFAVAAGGEKKLAVELVFNEAVSDQGDAGWFGVWSQQTGGSFMAYGALNPPKTIDAGDVLILSPEAVVLTLD